MSKFFWIKFPSLCEYLALCTKCKQMFIWHTQFNKMLSFKLHLNRILLCPKYLQILTWAKSFDLHNIVCFRKAGKPMSDVKEIYIGSKILAIFLLLLLSFPPSSHFSLKPDPLPLLLPVILFQPLPPSFWAPTIPASFLLLYSTSHPTFDA